MFSDTVEVGSRVVWIGNSSVGMSHLLVNQDGRQLARADSVLVAFDYTIEKPMRVPDEWRATLAAHEGRSLEKPVVPA
jgi:acyl-CoA thioester hydrolase